MNGHFVHYSTGGTTALKSRFVASSAKGRFWPTTDIHQRQLAGPHDLL
jgi:hypothetical protein